MKKVKYVIATIAFVTLIAYNFGTIKGDSSLENNLFSLTKAYAGWDEWGFPINDTPVSTVCNCPESCKRLECLKVCCPLKIEGTCLKTCNE